jgi:hypothetical protein
LQKAFFGCSWFGVSFTCAVSFNSLFSVIVVFFDALNAAHLRNIGY